MSYTLTTTRAQTAQERLATTRQPTTTTTRAMDKVRVQDGDDRSSESVDLSALNDNETDDFGRRILAHQREKLAQQNDQSRPLFPRARPRPLRPKTLDPLITVGGTLTEKTRPSHQRNASEGDYKATPGLNVPQEWGRRAKRREWQRRSVSDENRIIRQDKDSIFPIQTLYTGDDGSVISPVVSPGGGFLRHSVEDTPPSMTRKRLMSSPSSMRHMNTTLQDVQSEGAAFEFNEESMLVSTPAAVNRRDRKIDAMMKVEIEAVEKQGIAKRRVSEILERPGSAPSSDLASRVAKRRERRLSNKENAGETIEDEVDATAVVETRKVQRSHSRTDSIALLRTLARVSSLSPSPGRNEEPDPAVRPEEPPVSSRTDETRATSGKASMARDQLEARRVRINDDKARREEVAEVEATPARQEPDRGQAHKTPVVTGAWVDTPGKPQESQAANTTENAGPGNNAQHARVSALNSTSSNARAARRGLSEPTHPKSALEAVVTDAKTSRDPQLGDSTLASLENIVNPNLERTNSNTVDDLSRDIPSDAESLKHLTQAEKDRRQEDLALEALNKRLRSTRTTIKDAARDIQRIENQMEHVQDDRAKPEIVTHTAHEVVYTHGQQIPPWPRHLKPYTQSHNSRTICEHCGGSYTSVYSALWTETREFFFTYKGTNHDRPRPTAVGWAVLLWILWYCIESSLCDPWGYSRIAEAHFPFALPALLFKPFRWLGWMEYPVGRWFGEMIVEPVLHFVSGGGHAPVPVKVSIPASAAGAGEGRLYESAVTGTPYSEWIKATATTVSGATTKMAQSVGDALDQAGVGQMWDDEYLEL
ncbi:hypothetical protein CERZMDRAFT_106757 [Cercospora zeae-maydis SCOH1-5]|uniref:Uncharacterized protein n=1 Tax=Cercospora zeae-maydis SCOH1-5 TaxID=717836 RepID=A0A6A6FBK6_9PEZI|nr:hypothetical protein CERZMDRAFT_106757 [Cercospora zeae-maydis SCOH1-5]